MPSIRPKLLAASVAFLAFISPISTAHGQFTTVYNVPPDADPRIIFSDTQLNVFDGGIIANGFLAGSLSGTSSNVEVNVSGGSVGFLFTANGGTEVNFSGGSVGNQFTANAGSEVNISGGSVGALFTANGGSEINVLGGSFADGNAFLSFLGSEVNISGGSLGSILGLGAVTISGGKIRGDFSIGGSAKISGGSFGRVGTNIGRALEILGAQFRLDGELIDGLDQVGNTVQLNVPSEFDLDDHQMRR